MITSRRFALRATTLLVAALLSHATLAQSTMRTVEGGAGAVEIPAEPQRVAAMTMFDADYGIILGLPLVAIGTSRGIGDQLAIAPHQRGSVPDDIGIIAPFETNWEQLAGWRPDLIIGESYADNARALEAAIAPTLVFPEGMTAWRERLRWLGTTLDREQAAEGYISQYEAEAAAVAAKIEPGTKLGVVVLQSEGGFRLRQGELMPVIYKDLGFEQGEFVTETFDESAVYSLERLDVLADLDVIYLWVNLDESGLVRRTDEFDQMKTVPGWDELKAVQAGHVYEIPGELTYDGAMTAREVVKLIDSNL